MNGAWRMPAIAYAYTAHFAAGEPELAHRLLESLPMEDRPDLIRCLAMQTRMQTSIWPSPAAEQVVRGAALCDHPECVAVLAILRAEPVRVHLTAEQIAAIASTLAYINCDSAAAQGIDGPAFAAIQRKVCAQVGQMMSVQETLV